MMQDKCHPNNVLNTVKIHLNILKSISEEERIQMIDDTELHLKAIEETLMYLTKIVYGVDYELKLKKQKVSSLQFSQNGLGIFKNETNHLSLSGNFDQYELDTKLLQKNIKRQEEKNDLDKLTVEAISQQNIYKLKKMELDSQNLQIKELSDMKKQIELYLKETKCYQNNKLVKSNFKRLKNRNDFSNVQVELMNNCECDIKSLSFSNTKINENHETTNQSKLRLNRDFYIEDIANLKLKKDFVKTLNTNENLLTIKPKIKYSIQSHKLLNLKKIKNKTNRLKKRLDISKVNLQDNVKLGLHINLPKPGYKDNKIQYYFENQSNETTYYNENPNTISIKFSNTPKIELLNFSNESLNKRLPFLEENKLNGLMSYKSENKTSFTNQNNKHILKINSENIQCQSEKKKFTEISETGNVLTETDVIVNQNAKLNYNINNDEMQNICFEERKKINLQRLKTKKFNQMKEEEKCRIIQKNYFEKFSNTKGYEKDPNLENKLITSKQDNSQKQTEYIDEKIDKRSKTIYDYRKLLQESRYGNSKTNLLDCFEEDNKNKNTDKTNSKHLENDKNNLENLMQHENIPNDNIENDFSLTVKLGNHSQENDTFNVDCEIDKDNAEKQIITENENDILVEMVIEEPLVKDPMIESLNQDQLPNDSENFIECSNIKKDLKDNQMLMNETDICKSNDNINETINSECISKVQNENVDETSKALILHEKQMIFKPSYSSENKFNTNLESNILSRPPTPIEEDAENINYKDTENSEIPNVYDEVKSSESPIDVSVPEEEINNPKYWNKYCYFVEPPNIFQRKLACIIRAKPGSIPKRISLKCELIPASYELPYLDKREDYASYIFKITNRDSESMFKFDLPWYLSIPYYLLDSKAKEPVIMIQNEELNKWVECNTNDVIFENMKQNNLHFVETRIYKSTGTFAVVSSLNKEKTVITKEGSQLTCLSDRNIVLSVPPDSLKISVNTSLQVNSIDAIFWKEIKEKHNKGPLEKINFTSAIIEIEAKRKKLTNPATLTLKLPVDTSKFQEGNNRKKKIDDNELVHDKVEEDKLLLNKELNSFQKTLLMGSISNTNHSQDLHLLNYINEEDRWNITKDNNLIFDGSKNQISIELPAIQSSKFILLKSKRNTNEETIAKAAKIIENEFGVRNCIIALLQSINALNQFALIVSLKKAFQNNLKILQDEGYMLDTNNKLVQVELKERQIITTKFVGNIRNVMPGNCETLFTFHSLFSNIQKFKVREVDCFAQRAVLTFRGYLDLYTTTLVKKPVQTTDTKSRKNQIQYTWAEENVIISHLLITISKCKLPYVTPFCDFQFKFKNYKNCMSLIHLISTKIGLNWWDLGLHLEVTETRMHSIRLHNQDRGLSKMAEQMLLFWLKGCETQENKYDRLKNALKFCGRSDILDRLSKSQDLIFGC